MHHGVFFYEMAWCQFMHAHVHLQDKGNSWRRDLHNMCYCYDVVKDGHHYGNKEIMNNAYLANFLRGKVPFYAQCPTVVTIIVTTRLLHTYNSFTHDTITSMRMKPSNQDRHNYSDKETTIMVVSRASVPPSPTLGSD